MVDLRKTAAIVGVYEHPTRYAPDKSEALIMAESMIYALNEAGFTKKDVDALFSAGGPPAWIWWIRRMQSVPVVPQGILFQLLVSEHQVRKREWQRYGLDLHCDVPKPEPRLQRRGSLHSCLSGAGGGGESIHQHY